MPFSVCCLLANNNTRNIRCPGFDNSKTAPTTDALATMNVIMALNFDDQIFQTPARETPAEALCIEPKAKPQSPNLNETYCKFCGEGN